MKYELDHVDEAWFGGRRNVLPRKERRKQGRNLRVLLPRSAHAGATWPTEGRDPVALLELTNVGRVPELVPIRYGRMLRTPLAFLRGAAIVMAHDLASAPTTGIHVQICGDCHLQNFGWFATPERNLIFDVTDFDETVAGPWEWDVKRLAASIAVAARQKQFNRDEQRRVTAAAVRTYRRRVDEFSRLPTLELWSARLDGRWLQRTARTDRERRLLQQVMKQARRRTVTGLMPKLTTKVNGSLRFLDQPPLIYHAPHDEKFAHNARDLFHRYRETLAEDRRHLLDRFRLLDLAFKVVGVGSVGLRCGIALLVDDDDQPMILQIKEARPSVCAPFLPHREVAHQGHRIVQGQRLIQAASDLFLGWCRDDDGRDSYVRQLRDMKMSVEIETMTGQELADYAELCGWALARAHAKSGHGAEIAGYLGRGRNFDEAVAEFAVRYADQNDADYQVLLEAAHSGRVVAAVEV